MRTSAKVSSTSPPKPVSYTHLDVYKRQLINTARGGRSAGAGPAFFSRNTVNKGWNCLFLCFVLPSFIERVSTEKASGGWLKRLENIHHVVVNRLRDSNPVISNLNSVDSGCDSLRNRLPINWVLPVSYTHLDVYKRQI